jgi:hypothetical protein
MGNRKPTAHTRAAKKAKAQQLGKKVATGNLPLAPSQGRAHLAKSIALFPSGQPGKVPGSGRAGIPIRSGDPN